MCQSLGRKLKNSHQQATYVQNNMVLAIQKKKISPDFLGMLAVLWMAAVYCCCTEVFLQPWGSKASQGRSKPLFSFSPNRPPTIWAADPHVKYHAKALYFLPWQTDKRKG